jgi:hypothetical protein
MLTKWTERFTAALSKKPNGSGLGARLLREDGPQRDHVHGRRSGPAGASQPRIRQASEVDSACIEGVEAASSDDRMQGGLDLSQR